MYNLFVKLYKKKHQKHENYEINEYVIKLSNEIK